MLPLPWSSPLPGVFAMLDLKTTRVLVTGGAGLVGSHIVDQLLTEGTPRIVVLDNLSRGRRENLADALRHPSVELVEGDLRDRALVERLVREADVVFHQAAIRITQCAQEPRLALEVLVNGTFNVVEAAAKAGVKRVVAASSASVYGMADRFPTSEDHHPYRNRTLYGASKVFLEGLLRSYREMTGLSYVALRYFNIYGPRMDAHGVYTEVLIRWMERIAEGQPPIILGDGRQTMDFIYAEDVARANLLAARADVDDDVFNIGSGRETSLAELADTLLEVMGSKLKPEHQPERKVNPVARRLADVSRAEKALGFRARVPLAEGMRRLYEWWEVVRAAKA